MKKLMIILLVGMLSLGLSGIVYAVGGDEKVDITIATAVGITTAGAAFSDADAAAGGDWTDNSNSIVINANCPYDVTVKFSSDAEPATETTADAYMTAIDGDSVEWNLDSVFKLGYYSTGGTATSADVTMTSGTEITSSDVTFVSCPVEPLNGTNTLGIVYTQPISQYTDIAYTASGAGAQLTYSISLTWTISPDI